MYEWEKTGAHKALLKVPVSVRRTYRLFRLTWVVVVVLVRLLVFNLGPDRTFDCKDNQTYVEILLMAHWFYWLFNNYTITKTMSFCYFCRNTNNGTPTIIKTWRYSVSCPPTHPPYITVYIKLLSSVTTVITSWQECYYLGTPFSPVTTVTTSWQECYGYQTGGIT